jgi:hypothetical protein
VGKFIRVSTVGVDPLSDGWRSRRPRLRFFEPASNACTFPQVGRRDPLGVGLRFAEEHARTFRRSSRTRDIPADSLDGIITARGRYNSVSVRPAASASGVTAIGPGAGPVPGRLLAAVFSNRPRRNADLRRYSFGYFQDPS